MAHGSLKGVSMALTIIITITVLIVVGLAVIMITTGGLGRLGLFAGGQIGGAEFDASCSRFMTQCPIQNCQGSVVAAGAAQPCTSDWAAKIDIGGGKTVDKCCESPCDTGTDCTASP